MKNKHSFLSGKSVVAAGILSLMVFVGCENNLDAPSAVNGETSSSDAAAQAQNHVANELLIKFKKGTSASGRAAALARISGKVKEHILTKAMQGVGDEGVYLVHVPTAALEAVARAKGVEVEYAEPNWIYQHQASSDPYYTNGSLWGMYGDATNPANQFGSQAGEAWSNGSTGLGNVVVGIIDEGIQFTHPDLDANIWTNPYDPADGVDNDGNGYVDDIHGWDFDGNNNTIYDGGTRGSLDDHGTHVAGTIGAEANNGAGVVGVNWNVTMISGKFLGRRGGSLANAVKAVDYFTNLKKAKGLNIVATNNSWGGGGYSQTLFDAISRANTAGILFIAAAGNSGSDNDATASYPANYDLPNVISVAAIDSKGDLASFSQFGATTVDLGAPGVGVWSTTAYNSYSSYNGTSMATPHVTGAAALYASTHPGATAAQIKDAILGSAIPTPSLTGKTFTGGRLNASQF